MKKISLLTCCMLISFSTMACPDFAGIYRCAGSSNFSDLEVLQSGNTFILTTDGGTGDAIIADGITREIINNDNTVVSEQHLCTAQKVISTRSLSFNAPDGSTILMISETSESEKVDDVLTYTTTTTFSDGGDDTRQITCIEL